MKLEYQTRDKEDGKFKREQDIENITIQEDTPGIAYLIVEKSDGSKKRYLLSAI